MNYKKKDISLAFKDKLTILIILGTALFVLYFLLQKPELKNRCYFVIFVSCATCFLLQSHIFDRNQEKTKTENEEISLLKQRLLNMSDEHSDYIKYLSCHDMLTGLYNRHYIEEIIEQVDNEDNLPISVVLIDINGLKIANNIFGHELGDSLLKSVANLLRSHCKTSDYVGRWGGDEFVIVMPKTPKVEAEETIRELREIKIPIDENNLTLSLSFGCSCKDNKETTMRSTVQHAEEYMYHQKLLDGKSYRNSIISTLLATLYEKSNETEAHSKRIEKYCHAIAREMGLSSKEIDDISLLALLHDIGKIGIHPNILQKPNALTKEEWEEMKQHPEIGYRIARSAPELAMIAELILFHHERWDGAGYPRGLEKEKIPLACRILSVVDSFDAMTNDRIYRKAMPVSEAMAEIVKNSEKQFDPQIVNILLRFYVSTL